MSVTESIRSRVLRIQKGEPFTTGDFLGLGSRPAVDKALSRFVEEGLIDRVARGVFVRPKTSKFVGRVMPSIAQVINAMAKSSGEILQIHGAEAVRRFQISTQMPVKPIYYTNGASREITVFNTKVRLIHTSSAKKLQHAGTNVGAAISALWYLGKDNVGKREVLLIKKGLSEVEFKRLCASRLPNWMSEALKQHITKV
ncbi:type IV toxin-antitoxin system AbiEi family antitoxin domain-containing protein [Aliikangiella marina]|uniref:Type IV toxin-antitoxin system AbiEi family antitoxin domain-containing protein n=1 Tax=Aliikangiella marina TaxID=1712262 RepID=A0A545T7E2_9GAMM|nr:DUF6088 family protein [Aliikangiella marina]TQV73102.1 type IV toxin-antitoxin system AbiEi family antitoxin domain-containing protein [Aliikangiella marina]